MPHILIFLHPQRLAPFLLFLIFIWCSVAAQAQSALDGFDPNANAGVRVIVVQPDGKILIGGDFTTLAPNGGASVTRNRIARLNPDGTLDTAFNPNANGFIVSIVVQADGKILVGGFFTTIGGQTRNRIARLDPTTGLADSFDPNANNFVNAIAVQADGNILVGGQFSGANSIGGQTRNGIARLDPVTGLADSFNPNPDSYITVIALQPDGKIIVGGNFTAIGGQTRNRMARLDPVTGSADSFNPNANNLVQAIALQPDGKILASGLFFGANSIGGQTRNYIARLDAATGAADSFNPNASNNVISIAVQPDGKILAVGGYTSIGGQTRNNIARLDPATGLADSFNPNAGDVVLTVAVQQDGKILVGGFFAGANTIGGVTRNRIARLETDGRVDRTLDLGMVGNFVFTTAVQPDGKILIGGNFTNVLGVARNYIARLNTDGTLDMAFDPSANFFVSSIAVQADGKILAGGTFTVIGGQARNRIARIDPTSGAVDSFDPNASNGVSSIAVQPDGKIIVGGNFTAIGGQTRNNIARLDPTSGAVDSFDPNASGQVNSIALQADGKILAGGFFTTIGGQTRNNIARLDATTGAADSWNPNANFYVASIAVQVDGKILAGGEFTSIGGQTRNCFARLDPISGAADSFDPNANGSVTAIAVQADGKILAGGYFTSIGGQTRNFIARLDATTGAADSWNPNANFYVVSIAVQADGKILAGGNFTSIGGHTRNTFARLNNDTAALQNLAVTQNTVTWTRSGSSPQLMRVTFESSTDNVNYTSLGNGTATGSNWTLTGLNLPIGQNIYIRARGYYRTGVGNGSESILESVRNAFLAAGLIINEIDYDQPGTDTAEFIELKNVGGVMINLDPVVVELINGSSCCTPYQSIDLPNVNLAAGDYYVICADSATAANCDLDITPDTNLVQNGAPDAVGLRISGNLFDTVSYEGDTGAPYTEGSGSGLIDDNTTAFIGISRFPDGVDTNVNNVDLSPRCITPGTTNTSASTSCVAPTPSPTPTATNTPTNTPTPVCGSSTFSYTGPAVAIPDNLIAGVNFTIPVTGLGLVNDLNFTFDGIQSADPFSTTPGINHSWVGDLKVTIIAPGGQGTVVAYDRPGVPTSSFGCENNNIAQLTLDDDGGFPSIETNCDVAGTSAAFPIGNFSPNNPLSVFDGISPNGDWIVNISDNAVGDSGSARAFSLVIESGCGTPTATNTNTPTNTATNTPTATATNTPTPGSNLLFVEDFADNSAGWTLGNEWQIGSATASSGQNFGFPDPDTDTTATADNGVAGIIIGGNASTTVHSFNYLTSPPIDTNVPGAITLSFNRWLNSDFQPFMVNVIEVWNGISWNQIWITGGQPPVVDEAWTPQIFDVTAHKNPAFRIRFGMSVGHPAVLVVSSWNIDDVTITSDMSTATPTNTPTPTPAETPSISGTVTYVNASAPPKFISNVLISGAGSPNVSTTTLLPGAGAGTYSLTGFGAGAYTVTPTKPTGGVNSISSFDAGKIAQHVAGVPPLLNATQLIAADASGNGSVSSFDAGQIARFVTSSPPFGISGTWRFFTPGPTFPVGASPTSRTYPSVSSTITGEDYVGILVGEVSGNWNPSTAPIRPAGGPERSTAVNLPLLVTPADNEVIIPVAVQGAANKGIISYEFDLRYDPSVIQPLADPVDVAGTVSRGLYVVVNPTEPGLLRVAVYGAMPIDENGVLLNLRFTAVGEPGTVSPLTWERIMFNEGKPEVSAVDGLVELSKW